jgi:hypothetical protein
MCCTALERRAEILWGEDMVVMKFIIGLQAIYLIKSQLCEFLEGIL